MGRLRNEADVGEAIELTATHVVGRSRACHLVLDGDAVSGQHAAFTWTPSGWQIHDLGSRNGTWVDGIRLEVGGRTRLGAGSVVAFGHPALSWRLVCEQGPVARAVCVGTGQTVCAVSDTLTLPDDDHPRVTLYRGASGDWLAETDTETRRVADGELLVVDAIAWRLELPVPVVPTTGIAPPPRVDRVRLSFSVSADEEYVELVAVPAEGAGPPLDLGARAHHYLLLTLARARVADRDLHPDEQGWVHSSDLVRMLRVTEQQLNLQIWRARQQLLAAGFLDGVDIVHRRMGTGLIRIGAPNLAVGPLDCLP